MAPHRPLLVILGPTGVGKSKLSLELAQRFNGEIISADSMQVYKGLDVATNKVSVQERASIRHHMMDFLEPSEKFSVVQFRNKTLPIIRDLHSQAKLPIIVGGTHYYIESLIWKNLVEAEDIEDPRLESDLTTVQAAWSEAKIWASTITELKSRCIENQLEVGGDESDLNLIKCACERVASVCSVPPPEFASLDTIFPFLQQCDFNKTEEILNLTTAELKRRVRDILTMHSAPLKVQVEKEMNRVAAVESRGLHEWLKRLDPVSAATLHPNNRRKIIRSIQVFVQKGRTHSDILSEQRNDGGNIHGGPLRFSEAVLIWLRCKQDVLDSRLDSRVDEMVSHGLINELSGFHRQYNEDRVKGLTVADADYTKGIFQSIGFKEFHSYLQLTDSQRATDEGKKLLEEGTEALKLTTRRYARRQIKWILNRFIRTVDRQVPPIFGLNTTNLEAWNENVRDPAFAITQALLSSTSSPIPPIPREQPEFEFKSEKNFCNECQRVFVDGLQWKIHLSSNKHKRVVKRLMRTAEECNKKMKSDPS